MTQVLCLAPRQSETHSLFAEFGTDALREPLQSAGTVITYDDITVELHDLMI